MRWKCFGIQRKGTKRTMGLMHIIICLLLNDEVHSVFEIIESPSPFTWKTALQHCTNSRIDFTVAIPAVNLTRMRVIDEIALKGEAWVGFFQSYKHFLFIVCVPLSEIESNISARFSIGRTDNRPGMCYSLCGLQGYIGLQDGNCYCIAKRNFHATDTQTFNSSCEKPLHCGNGMLCGDQGYSTISVYKEVTISSNDIKDDDSGCLIVTRDKSYEMSVVNCESNYRHICEAQTGQNLYLSVSPEKQQWVYSINTCAKVGKKPATFIEDITNFTFPNVSEPLWTSVVRDLVIRNCSGACTTIGSHSYQGFLKNCDGIIELEFVHAGNDSRKRSVVCMSGEKMQYSTSVKKNMSHKMTSSDPAKAMSTRTTSKATSASFASGEKMQYSTSVKKNMSHKMTSSDPAKAMSTRTTSKATSASFASGEKMQYSTSVTKKKSLKMTSSNPAKAMSTCTTTKATSASFVSESTVDLTLFLAVVVSSTSLLVISVLLNIYFIRKKLSMQMENTTELQYVIPMTHEEERGRYETISAALSTEIRSITETHVNISSSTASCTSPGQDQDGYLTPIIAGANAAYDYVE